MTFAHLTLPQAIVIAAIIIAVCYLAVASRGWR